MSSLSDMMDEYIKRRDAVEAIHASNMTAAIDQIIGGNAIIDVPAADIVAIRRGEPFPRYELFEDDDGAHIHRVQTGWGCPFCGSSHIAKFCADCGAKMDWGAENE